MPHPTSPSKELHERLVTLFGDETDCAMAILNVLGDNDGSDLGAKDLVHATNHRLVDVLVAVARLTVAGLIEHPRAGRYCRLDTQRTRRAS